MGGLVRDSRRSLCRDDDGAALIMVVVIVAVLVLLSFIAFVSAGTNDTSATSYNASVQADATASAGAAEAVYEIEVSTGSFPCSISSTSLLPESSGGLADAGKSSYSVSIAYYTSFPPTSSSLLTCSGGTVTPNPAALKAAVVASTGHTTVGPVSASETVTEQVFVSLAPNDYSVFQGGTSTLDLTHLLPLASSSTSSANVGVVYSNGGITALAGGACPAPPAPNVNPPNPPANTMAATLVAQGSLTFENCYLNGSVVLGSSGSGQGNLVVTNGIISGNATVSDGSATLSKGQVVGNLVDGGSAPGGNVVLCPNPLGPTSPAACSGLQAGASFVNGSVTAEGTVTLGTTLEPSGTPPCSPTSSSGDEVVGCITPSSPYAVDGPSELSLPKLEADTSGSDWFSAWQSAGDSAGNGAASTATVDQTSICTGTGAGSVWADVNGETGPTVVIANCAVSWSSGNLNAQYNTAIVAAGGISLSGNFAFTQPPPPPGTQPTPVQISLVVPAPTSSYTCGSSLSTTVNSNILGPQTQKDSFFLYTPCTLTISKGLNLTGEIVANTVNVTQNVKLAYPTSTAAFSPPGFNFGFQVVVEARYVTSGG